MKAVLLFLLSAAAVYAAGKPAVSDCFKVHSMTRADGEHYWADWTNTCPYTIDSVYVMIAFRDKFHKQLGDGVWGLHFVTKGAHRETRFTVPRGIGDFESVDIRKVTMDYSEAIH